MHLQICCQATCYLKPTSADLYKQLFDRASDFQVKANQLSDIQEKYLQRQGLKAELSGLEDEAYSVASSYDAEATKLEQLKEEEEACLEEALVAVRGETTQTIMNMQTFVSKASSAVEDIGNFENQLRQTTDHEEFYEVICSF